MNEITLWRLCHANTSLFSTDEQPRPFTQANIFIPALYVKHKGWGQPYVSIFADETIFVKYVA